MCAEPDWQPLIDLLASEFMWMHAVPLDDGRTLHAYKHRWTRRYIHLTADGHAFEPEGAGAGYREADPFRVLYEALGTERECWGPLRDAA